MKIFFGILSLISVFGLLLAAFSYGFGRLGKKQPKDWTKRLLAYRPAWILICLVLFAVSVAGWQNSPYDDAPYEARDNIPKYVTAQYPVYSASYKVLRVTGGNEAEISLNRGPTPINLIGVELFKSPADSKQNTCYQDQAASKLKQILKGKQVELEGDDSVADSSTSDTLLRYLISDDDNVGKQMITLGFAKASANPNYKYHDEFAAAEKAAKAKRTGLWSSDICRPTIQEASAPHASFESIKSRAISDDKTRHKSSNAKDSVLRTNTKTDGRPQKDDSENNNKPSCHISILGLLCL